jgi:cytochrome P450
MRNLGTPAAHDLFSDNQKWGDLDSWNRAALALHDRGGIHRVERDGFSPFWAVTDHAAVMSIERRPAVFTNGPEPILQNADEIANRQMAIKALVHMDAPEHGKYRQLTADWFKPASISRLNDRLDELSRETLVRLGDMGGRCDFAVDIALPYPLQVILSLLGLPESDYPRMLALTQQLFGQEDPDLQRDPPSPETFAAIVMDFYTYFTELSAERRANPREDLATLIANGTIDGEALPDLETMGYYVIVATAGHDTTSSAMAGGMHALIEHQDQLRRLQDEPDLLNNAVEEMLRWTSPVRHFMRTAQEDTEICGQEIKKGDWLYLSYKAANLDPKVFGDPLTFDISRGNADKQISFGYGVHFCLGAQLARNELRSLFGHLVPRLDSIAFDGASTTAKTTFVGGHKNLPISYTLRP